MDPVVVFLVHSHHKRTSLERLVERLADTSTALTVVHHDRAAEVRPSLAGNQRAMFVPEPQRIEWGRLSVPGAVLSSLKWIRREIPSVHYVLLLSGQDYPAMSPRSIEAELLATDVDAFISWEVIPPLSGSLSSDWQRGASRRYYWHRVPGRFRPVPVPRLRHFFDQVPIFAGSIWFNLGRRALDRILDDEARLAYLTDRRFRGTMLPGEAFFQTALLNAATGLTIANDHRRFFRFPTWGAAAHPETLSLDDLDAIRSSGAFFARKVDEAESHELLDRLDQSSGYQASARESHALLAPSAFSRPRS
jgi:hypothetical protein